MAEHTTHYSTAPGAPHGQMDIREQTKTWLLFNTIMRWSIGGCVGLLVFLAIFRTH